MGACAIKSANPNLIEETISTTASISSDDQASAQLSSEVSQVMRILINYEEIKCPVCMNKVDSDDPEIHLLMCLTRTKLHYNEDRITEETMKLGGECIICLEELQEDDIIARLPCLCVYHKSCIDQWFLISRTCPQHPTTYSGTSSNNNSHHINNQNTSN